MKIDFKNPEEIKNSLVYFFNKMNKSIEQNVAETYYKTGALLLNPPTRILSVLYKHFAEIKMKYNFDYCLNSAFGTSKALAYSRQQAGFNKKSFWRSEDNQIRSNKDSILEQSKKIPDYTNSSNTTVDSIIDNSTIDIDALMSKMYKIPGLEKEKVIAMAKSINAEMDNAKSENIFYSGKPELFNTNLTAEKLKVHNENNVSNTKKVKKKVVKTPVKKKTLSKSKKKK